VVLVVLEPVRPVPLVSLPLALWPAVSATPEALDELLIPLVLEPFAPVVLAPLLPVLLEPVVPVDPFAPLVLEPLMLPVLDGLFWAIATDPSIAPETAAAIKTLTFMTISSLMVNTSTPIRLMCSINHYFCVDGRI